MPSSFSVKRTITHRPTFLLRVGFIALGLGACSKPTSPPPSGSAAGSPDSKAATASASVNSEQSDLLARERAAAYVAKDERSRAREALAPLVARKDATFEDLIDAASIEMADNKTEIAGKFLDRAEKLAPKSPAVLFMRGQMAREAGETKTALAFLQQAHAAAPDDLPTMIILGAVLDDLDDTAAAEKLYRTVVAVGFENGQQWYVSAVNRLASILLQTGREKDAEPFNAVRHEFELKKIKGPSTLAMLLGEFGRVRAPKPEGSRVEKREPPVFREAAAILPELADARALVATDLDHDSRLDLFAYGPHGVVIALRRGASFEVKTIASGACDFALAYDADNDGDLDVLVETGGKLALYEAKDASWSLSKVAFPPLPGVATSILATDYDHEGDLDLLCTGAFGARVFRRDGGLELDKAIYTDASADSGLPADRAFDWAITEDFDGDNDVDFLFGGAQGLYLADSLRAGHFTEKRGLFDAAGSVKPIVADFDGDARADLWIPGAPSSFVSQGKKARASVAAANTIPARVATADFDLDGALDVVWSDGAVLKGVLAPGLAAEREFAPGIAAAGVLCAGDFDGDGRADIAVSAKDGIHVLTNAGPAGLGFALSLQGYRDNQRGVGAVVEVRAGPIYRRTYWRGEPALIGLGGEKKIDVLRVTWPNGVGITDLDLDPSAKDDKGRSKYLDIPQPSGQVGSCPFLYAWNGKTYTFISDVLGITPLGLPIEPGVFVPPDHDEYVLVKGEQLVPKDGVYELQFTEELREVTYLDHAKLLVVDHPADTEIYPNELFTFPPFPVAHTHTVKAPLAPVSAVASDGKDWKRELSAIDDVHAEPFTLQPPQFAGLAQPWFVELAFDKDAVLKAKKLRLLLTGWFFWSDASANMASARNPETPFIPPILQVPDGKGGWRDTGPPVGFPAGKTKTMVIDVTDLLVRDDPRIRVFTSLRLYWDSARLAVDADDAPLTVHEIPCASANLWRRGFSAPLDPICPVNWAHPKNMPERFDWNVLADEPRWNQHPGNYTRYGDCAPLVAAVEDQFVILGSGDALTLRFDAKSTPALAPGMRRDYLLYLDGWAKDRDPNTIQALEVEPLPFHAMSGYPYRADEHFPDDAAHLKWRAEWNTRSAWRWIRPISPQRESEWLLSVPPRPEPSR
jgi:tetratricopeptide (TPR) repeat protein